MLTLQFEMQPNKYNILQHLHFKVTRLYFSAVFTLVLFSQVVNKNIQSAAIIKFRGEYSSALLEMFLPCVAIYVRKVEAVVSVH